MTNELLRHMLATLAYRLRKTVHGADDTFGRFDAGNGVRRPAEIVNHIAHVLLFTRYVLQQESDRPTRPELLGLSEELRRLFAVLGEVDALLAQEELSVAYAKKLMQGPFADALTHVGQIAMLRRLAGGKIPGENFAAAPITTGVFD